MPSRDDTKVCPYCAEVIKAAAIKCRFCQSDLTDTVAAAPVAPIEPDPAPVETVEPEPDPVVPAPVAEKPTEPSRSPRRLTAGVVGALVVALLASAVFLYLAFRDWQEAEEITSGDSAARTVRASITEKVEALLAYDYTTFDEDLDAAKEGMTESFQDEYEPTVEEIRDRATALKRSQVAEVVAVAVVSQSEDEVEALVFVNTIASRVGTEAQRLMQNRVNVTLVREDGEWLIDELSVPQA